MDPTTYLYNLIIKAIENRRYYVGTLDGPVSKKYGIEMFASDLQLNLEDSPVIKVDKIGYCLTNLNEAAQEYADFIISEIKKNYDWFDRTKHEINFYTFVFVSSGQQQYEIHSNTTNEPESHSRKLHTIKICIHDIDTMQILSGNLRDLRNHILPKLQKERNECVKSLIGFGNDLMP